MIRVVFAATAAQGVACDVSILVFPSFHFSFSSCSQLRGAALCVTARHVIETTNVTMLLVT